MTKNHSKAIKTLTTDLLLKLAIKADKVTVKPGDDSDYLIAVTVPEADSGVLIGYHGETISSIQLILALILQGQVKSWHRLTLDINDYRQKRLEDLNGMAEEAVARVVSSGEEIVMPAMGSFDRRIIHLALDQNQAVRTESVGEGRDRRLIIYPNSVD